MENTYESARKFKSPTDVKVRLVEILNHQLADTIDLRSQVRQAYLNVRGLYAPEVRRLLDGLVRDLRIFVDILGRRISVLGGRATATVRSAARQSTLPYYPPDAADAREHLEALLASCSTYEKDSRRNMKAARELGDRETAALFRVVGSSVENDLWFLNAYLEGVSLHLQASKLPPWTSAFKNGLMDV